jgi:outer membrane lipopolysaccharide assembly protein LptE/RlpB
VTRVRDRRPIVAAFALGVALVAAGCGYSVRGHLPADVRTIAIPVLANKTTKPAVETEMTRALSDAFATDGRLQVVSRDRADSVLEGEVTGYELISIAFDPRANVRLYRLVVTMNVRLRDVRRHTLLFEQHGFSEKADFRVLGAVSETIAREEIALRAAAVDIARAVVALAIERF